MYCVCNVPRSKFQTRLKTSDAIRSDDMRGAAPCHTQSSVYLCVTRTRRFVPFMKGPLVRHLGLGCVPGFHGDVGSRVSSVAAKLCFFFRCFEATIKFWVFFLLLFSRSSLLLLFPFVFSLFSLSLFSFDPYLKFSSSPMGTCHLKDGWWSCHGCDAVLTFVWRDKVLTFFVLSLFLCTQIYSFCLFWVVFFFNSFGFLFVLLPLFYFLFLIFLPFFLALPQISFYIFLGYPIPLSINWVSAWTNQFTRVAVTHFGPPPKNFLAEGKESQRIGDQDGVGLVSSRLSGTAGAKAKEWTKNIWLRKPKWERKKQKEKIAQNDEDQSKIFTFFFFTGFSATKVAG